MFTSLHRTLAPGDVIETDEAISHPELVLMSDDEPTQRARRAPRDKE